VTALAVAFLALLLATGALVAVTWFQGVASRQVELADTSRGTGD